MKAPIYPPRTRSDHFVKHASVQSTLVSGTLSSTPPMVSVLIPTFRRPDMLREAIASALNQRDFDDYEVIVADNDAENTGDLHQLIAEFHSDKLLYYKHAQNLGMTGNWNRLIELARGRWISFLHDDDWLAPDFLARMFAKRPDDAVLMACSVPFGDSKYSPELLTASAELRRSQPRRFTLAKVIFDNIAPSPGIISMKQLAVQLGGFDDDLYPCADYDFYLRMTFSGPCYYLLEPLAYYRTTDSQTNKGDTFYRMTVMTARIRYALVESAPTPFHYAVYMEATRRWLTLAAGLGIRDPDIGSSLPDKLVMILLKMGPWAAPYSKLVGGANRLQFLHRLPYEIAGSAESASASDATASPARGIEIQTSEELTNRGSP